VYSVTLICTKSLGLNFWFVFFYCREFILLLSALSASVSFGFATVCFYKLYEKTFQTARIAPNNIYFWSSSSREYSLSNWILGT
jgi:hypothetical protein